MIDVENWAEIRRLHRAEGLSIKAIVRRSKLARNTVRDALRGDEPPRYERAGAASAVDAVDAVEPQIRELLAEFPTMPATVIAERIGWERGITILRDRVAELRPLFVPPDPCQRQSYAPASWHSGICGNPTWRNQPSDRRAPVARSERATRHVPRLLHVMRPHEPGIELSADLGIDLW